MDGPIQLIRDSVRITSNPTLSNEVPGEMATSPPSSPRDGIESRLSAHPRPPIFLFSPPRSEYDVQLGAINLLVVEVRVVGHHGVGALDVGVVVQPPVR